MNFKAIVIIPAVLVIVLALFSFLIGWNLLTLITFWFLIVPVMAVLVPGMLKINFPVRESLTGLSLFYLCMIWMIYDQFQSDNFQLMLLSLVVNVGLVILITFSLKRAIKS